MKDPQKTRLYAAEHTVIDTYNGTVGVQQFRSLQQMQSFVDRVTASDYWKSHSGPQRVSVFLGRKDSRFARSYSRFSSWYGKVQSDPFITIPPTWAASDAVLIHELAHQISDDAHGPIFASRYLDLLRLFVSPAIATKMQKAFDDHSVSYQEGSQAVSKQKVRAAHASAMKTQERAAQQERDALSFLHLLSKYQ